MATRTLKVRIRDKHAKRLGRMAHGVNTAWNYLNAYARHEWKAKRRFVNYAGPGGLAEQTAGSAKELGLLADTVQKVCAQFDTSKRQHKKAWLHFRGRRSLGWIPFKGITVKLEAGGFRFMKQRFQVWDSYGLDQFEARDGNIVQDTRGGRVFAEVAEKWTTQTCSECGSIAGPKGRAGLNERAWVCPDCGASHDRDINAARNILALGLGHGPPVGGILPL